jgi:prophage DNA circulation protein
METDMDMNYEIGIIKAQNAALKESVDTLTKTVATLTDEVEEIKTTVTTWRSTAFGAISVLSAIGAVVLWLSDGLVTIIKLKLGL